MKVYNRSDVLLNIVLDQSGSMAGLAKATIDGFNSMVKNEVDQADGNTYITLSTFSDYVSVRYVGEKAKKVSKLGTVENSYRPNGMTALFDAVGTSILGAEKWLENHPGFCGKVVTIIWTDGFENSSKEWNRNSINELIEKKQSKGWVFQFLGSGESGWLSGEVFSSIAPSNRTFVRSTGTATMDSYELVNASIASFRNGEDWHYNSNVG